MHSHPAAIPFRYVAIRHHRLLLQLERFSPDRPRVDPILCESSGSGCTRGRSRLEARRLATTLVLLAPWGSSADPVKCWSSRDHYQWRKSYDSTQFR
jgi:hypothetical protein